MYRKYSGLTKCSRNERLAQLSEQENVIEKKKKEILAKIEAKKKKETEEALRKFEPTNAHRNVSPVSKNKSCHREMDAADEEIKHQTPRNAFSNDGSFLDQFKKLSRSGLGSSSSPSVRATQKEGEDSNKTRQEYVEREENKKVMEIIRSRWDYDDDVKDGKSFDSRNPGDFNIYSQLPQPRVDHSLPEQIPGGRTKLKLGESNKVDSLHSVPAPGSLMTPADYEGKWKYQELDESSGSGYRPVESEKSQSAKKKFWDYDERHPLCLNSESYSHKNSSFGVDVSTRISPAFTHEAGNSVTSENCHSSKTVRHGEETPGLSTTIFANEAKKFLPEEYNPCATASHYLNPDKVRDIASFPKASESAYFREYNTERKRKRRSSEYDSSDSDSNPRDSPRSNGKTSQNINQLLKDKDGYQADYEDASSCGKTSDHRQKKFSVRSTATDNSHKSKHMPDESKDRENAEAGDVLTSGEARKRRKKSRWGDEVVPAAASNSGTNSGPQRPLLISPVICAGTGKTPMLSKLTRSDPGLLQYAKQTFGSTNLSEEDWKKAEDHYKINLLYQDMVKKRAEIEKLEKAGKFKYEYDSDEDVEGGTWEHKLRQQEMLATQLWAEELTRQAAGKHHIGDFLPPEELERFMERYNAVKQGRKPDLSDYKEFKLKEDNVGYRLLQKMGWNEGQGLGQDGSGITNPVNKAETRTENQGLGVERPDGLEAGDDEYDAYRKRMMLAYRFRPNPLNNPRRPYY